MSSIIFLPFLTDKKSKLCYLKQVVVDYERTLSCIWEVQNDERAMRSACWSLYRSIDAFLADQNFAYTSGEFQCSFGEIEGTSKWMFVLLCGEHGFHVDANEGKVLFLKTGSSLVNQ